MVLDQCYSCPILQLQCCCCWILYIAHVSISMLCCTLFFLLRLCDSTHARTHIHTYTHACTHVMSSFCSCVNVGFSLQIEFCFVLITIHRSSDFLSRPFYWSGVHVCCTFNGDCGHLIDVYTQCCACLRLTACSVLFTVNKASVTGERNSAVLWELLWHMLWCVCEMMVSINVQVSL